MHQLQGRMATTNQNSWIRVNEATWPKTCNHEPRRKHKLDIVIIAKTPFNSVANATSEKHRIQKPPCLKDPYRPSWEPPNSDDSAQNHTHKFPIYFKFHTIVIPHTRLTSLVFLFVPLPVSPYLVHFACACQRKI